MSLISWKRHSLLISDLFLDITVIVLSGGSSLYKLKVNTPALVSLSFSVTYFSTFVDAVKY